MAESGSLWQLKDLNNVFLLSFLIYFQFSLKSPFNFLCGKEYFILKSDLKKSSSEGYNYN